MSAIGARARRARDRARAALPAAPAQPAARPTQLLEEPQPPSAPVTRTGPAMAITAGTPRTSGPQQAAQSGPQPVLPPPSRAFTGPQPAAPQPEVPSFVAIPPVRRPAWSGPQQAARPATRAARVAGQYPSRRAWFAADVRSHRNGGLPVFRAVVAGNGWCGLDQVHVPDFPQRWASVAMAADESAARTAAQFADMMAANRAEWDEADKARQERYRAGTVAAAGQDGAA